MRKDAHKRIFDDPTHPQYGPVRRLWVILVQLDLLKTAEKWRDDIGDTWDHSLAHRLEYFDYSESMAQRIVLHRILEGHVTWPIPSLLS